MKIWINGLAKNDLSTTRGIGSYLQMAKESIESFGKKYDLTLDQAKSNIVIHPGFTPFQKLELKKNVHNLVVIHDVIPLKYKKKFKVGLKGHIRKWLNMQTLQKAKGVITDTHVVKQELTKYLNIPQQKIEVVYPAAKRVFEKGEYTKNNRAELYLPKKYLLYVGDVTWNKNLVRVAKAVINANLKLVLVGKALKNNEHNNNSWLYSFNKFKLLTKNKPNFHFLGYVADNDLAYIYKKASALVLPSIDEGFGLPWLEASYYNTISIVSDIPIFKEVAKGGAVFVDPYSENSIIHSMKSVWQDNTLTVIRKKQKKAIKHYSQEEFCKSLKGTIVKLAN